MIKINLLPQSKIKKAEHPEFLAIAQLVFLIVIIVFAVNYFILTMKLQSLKGEIALAQSEKAKYQATVNEINSIKTMTAELESKRELIKGLLNLRIFYPVFMEELLEHFPRGMWLTSLNTQSQDDGTIKATFNATAVDIYTIADLVKIMESSKVIKSHKLGAISQTGTEPNVTNSFTMEITYKK